MAKFKCISKQSKINYLGYFVKSGREVEIEIPAIAEKFRQHQDFEEVAPVKKQSSKKSKKFSAPLEVDGVSDSEKETSKE